MSFLNRTIDDEKGDEVTGAKVTYYPTQLWSQGNGCDHCSSRPDSSQAIDQTWHDGSRVPENDILPLTFSFEFTGNAVYLFNILQNGALTDVNITVDGRLAGRYTYQPKLPDFMQFVYDTPIFSQENLSFGKHSVEVSAFGPDHTIVLFDYALYTTTESGQPPAPPPQTSPPTTPTNTETAEHTSSSSPTPHDATSNPPTASSSASNTLSFSASSSPSSSLQSSSISPSGSSVPATAIQPTSSPTGSPSNSSGSLSSLPSSSAFPTGIGAASTSPSHHIDAVAIACGIGGSVLVLLTLFLAWLWYKRRHRLPPITPYDQTTHDAEATVRRTDSTRSEKPQNTYGYPIDRKTVLPAHPSEVSLLHPSDVAERAPSDVLILGVPASSTSGSSAGGTTEATLHNELRSLQDRLATIRAGGGIGSVYASTEASSPTTARLPYRDSAAYHDDLASPGGASGSSSSGRQAELQMLRVEIEQLRAQRSPPPLSQYEYQSTVGPSVSMVATSPVEAELMRQIAVLRQEMEQMRMQQELGMGSESLPSYSPPAQPIPGLYYGNADASHAPPS